MYFTNDQTAQLNDLIKKIEQRTGIELVATVVGKCDSYPEIPWKAFALAAAISGLALLVQALVRPAWTAGWSAQYAPVVILGAGAAVSLLSVFWPAFGRLFLNRVRAETEIDQYARAFFLERELFRTGSRTGILLLVGLFERRVVIVPDSGVAGRLKPQDIARSHRPDDATSPPEGPFPGPCPGPLGAGRGTAADRPRCPAENRQRNNG